MYLFKLNSLDCYWNSTSNPLTCFWYFHKIPIFINSGYKQNTVTCSEKLVWHQICFVMTSLIPQFFFKIANVSQQRIPYIYFDKISIIAICVKFWSFNSSYSLVFLLFFLLLCIIPRSVNNWINHIIFYFSFHFSLFSMFHVFILN